MRAKPLLLLIVFGLLAWTLIFVRWCNAECPGASYPGGSCTMDQPWRPSPPSPPPRRAAPPRAEVTYVNQAVCRVMVPEARGHSWGSGVLIDVDGASCGYVLTAGHMFREWNRRAKPICRFLIGPNQSQGYQAEVDGIDETADVAVLRIAKPAARPISLGETSPAKGETITALGWGSGQYRSTSGPVVQFLSFDQGRTWDVLECRAPVRQGDSGGAFLDGRGRLVGVIAAHDARAGRSCGTACGRIRAWLHRVLPRYRRHNTTPATCKPQPAVPADNLIPIIRKNTEAIAALTAQVQANAAAIAELQNHSPVAGPAGPAGPQGPVGPAGPQGPAGVSQETIGEIQQRLTALESATLIVRFAGGDEPSETERVIEVPLTGGEVVIPAQMLRVRTLDAEGNMVGEPQTDVAPLGSPLKMRNRIEGTVDAGN